MQRKCKGSAEVLLLSNTSLSSNLILPVVALSQKDAIAVKNGVRFIRSSVAIDKMNRFVT